jgi:hypothetical protein
MMIFRKYIAMLTTLIATIGNMPLKCKVFHVESLNEVPAAKSVTAGTSFNNYLPSPAPQAEGFG